jgi:hypothetical protein
MIRSCPASALVLLTLVLVPPRWASSQAGPTAAVRSEPLVVGDRHVVRMGSPAVERRILVIPPRSYGDTTRTFPVLYVLDGDEYVQAAAAAMATLSANGRIPEMLVVGIGGGDRGLDYTPELRRTTQLPPGVTAHGGAGAFLRVLRDEIVPLVERRYRVSPMRVVTGHSLGGLLAMHALATEPRLFRGYITMEPALWWDGRIVVDSVLAVLARDSTAARRLVAVEATSPEGWRPDWERLRRAAGDRARLVSLDGETHQTLFYRGVYEGLAAMFADYLPWMRHDEAHANVESLERQYARLSRDFGYEVPPPLTALFDVADREANQRRFAAARRAVAWAARSYPHSSAVPTWRAHVESIAGQATREGLKESTPVVSFRPIDPRDAAALAGEWAMSIRVEPGAPLSGTARFERRGDTLLVVTVARGIAVDGGDYRTAPAVVVREGDAFRWERENRGGGRVVTTVRLESAGRLLGTNAVVGGTKPPAGFVEPRVTVELRRR